MRIAVAMSGGVDSSVAALLLKEQGHEVVGVTMMLVDCDAGPGAAVPSCCGRQAVRDAQQVAAQLGINHYVLDFRKELEAEVVEDFCDEYARGRTPNPCIRCNERLKFRSLLGRAEQLGAEKLATGHYARLVEEEKHPQIPQITQIGSGEEPVKSAKSADEKFWRLRMAKDRTKDQSYFLYRLTQEQMARLVLPLGELTKAEVRDRARRNELPVAEKRESQEICFVGGAGCAGFLRGRRPELFRPGRVVDTEGRTLGRHDGIAGLTVGQRKGLGIALGERSYIIRLDPKKNEAVLGRYEDALSAEAELEQVHWVSGSEPGPRLEVTAKVRYQHPGAKAVVEPAGDRARVRFSEPQFAVTPGQSMVFYQDDTVLGGGVTLAAGHNPIVSAQLGLCPKAKSGVQCG